VLLKVLYTYIEKEYLGIKPLDLRRGVKYKKRKKHEYLRYVMPKAKSFDEMTHRHWSCR
jgi:hypothetical protein